MMKEEVFQFEFNGHVATVICPENPNGKWIWKTEFFYEQIVNVLIFLCPTPRIVGKKMSIRYYIFVFINGVKINIPQAVKPRSEQPIRALVDLITNTKIIIKLPIFV